MKEVVVFNLQESTVCFLSSEPFVLNADQLALQYTIKKKDVHGRLIKWMDFVSKYKSTIKYECEAKNKAADFLSSYGRSKPYWKKIAKKR